MSELSQRFTDAADDLRRELAGVEPPPFRPNRSGTPLLLVLVLLLGIGVVGYVARSGLRTAADGDDISVVTQPETPDDSAVEVPLPGPTLSSTAPGEPDVSEPDVSEPDVSERESDELGVGEATAQSQWVSVTNPAPGEIFVPLAAAWSPDETKLIVYRTGAADPAHLIVDTLDLDAPPIELPVTPPDIEQLYWHPLADHQLVYAEGANLMIFDLDTLQPVAIHRFDDCDAVDSGVLPVAPSNDGTMSLLCHAAGGVSQISYNLATGDERRMATNSTTAAFPSPSGDLFVQPNADGSATVRDRSFAATGRELDLQGNLFGFVVDADGREWVATTLFGGPAIGSVVLLGVDGAEMSVVLIGPDRGDPYPPPGTQISAARDKIAISISGSDDGLAGRITLLDLGTSFVTPDRRSIAHKSVGTYDYWSTPFLSVSPSGVLGYASDLGGDAVTTIVGNFISEVEPSE